jgi:uncharacterized protein YaaQ
MKLLVAIVQAADADRVSDHLRNAGHRFTRLTSLGGFLDMSNATFVMAADAADVPQVVQVFRDSCVGREVDIPLVLTERLRDWKERVAHYGGATIMVVDLEELIRL